MTKTENTLENKAKFFAQYWGVDVVNYGRGAKLMSVDFVDFIDLKNELFLELTPLSQIRNEDVSYLGENHAISFDEFGCYYGRGAGHSWTSSEIDYLRSKGYALPWMDLSVEDLVDYGWVKLKD